MKNRRPLRSGIAATALAVATTLALIGFAMPATAGARQQPAATGQDNVVIKWNQTALDAVIESKFSPPIGPPMVARGLAILHTCMYDAWAAYDNRAAGTQLGTRLRQPARERTPQNKAAAISYAAYTAAVDMWPNSAARFETLLTDLGYPKQARTRAGNVGVRACEAVLKYRHTDGANQLGDLGGDGSYTDYTGYKPVNSPMDASKPMDPNTMVNTDKWQPLIVTNQEGATGTQFWVGAHMGNVKPFAMSSWDQFKLTAPAKAGSPRYVQQAWEIVNWGANLTDQQKAISEYWADEGQGFAMPPGTWSKISQFVSRRDRHTVDQDVKMFFAVTNGVFDAAIAAWGYKRHYDYIRPISAIRYLFRGQTIPSYSRTGSGPELIDGASWHPYQPAFFPTPPFAEYPSGHATFGGGGGEVLKLFTGSDQYGESVTIRAGSSRVEPGISPTKDVTLSWPTFTHAVDENGISRRYGGLHFQDADVNGRALGRQAGANAFAKANRLFNGIFDPPIGTAGN